MNLSSIPNYPCCCNAIRSFQIFWVFIAIITSMVFIEVDFFIIQVIGFIAFGVSLLIYQLNKRKSMIFAQMFSSLLWSLHFLLLGAYTGSIMNFIGATRNLAFDRYRDRSWSYAVLWLFVGIFSLASILTWEGPLSILPAIGTISGAFAYWQRTAKAIRLVSLISPPAWFVYATFSSSYAGMVTEIFILSSILIGMYRHDRSTKELRARSSGI